VTLSLQDKRTASAALQRTGRVSLTSEVGRVGGKPAARTHRAWRRLGYGSLFAGLASRPGFLGSSVNAIAGGPATLLAPAADRMPASYSVLDPSTDQEEGDP
jgi:hypothetical protein